MSEDEKVDDEKVVNEEEIKKAEAEIKKVEEAKKAEEDKKAKEAISKQDEVRKLVDEAETKGKEVALKEYETNQRFESLEQEKNALKEMVEQVKKDAQNEQAAIKTELAKRFEELSAKKRGLSKNDSPFDKKDSEDVSDIVNADNIEEIDARSMEVMLGIRKDR